MTDWDKNEQMAAWDKKYVSTNVKPNARKYDKDVFLAFEEKLRGAGPDMRTCSAAIIVSLIDLPTNFNLGDSPIVFWITGF
jgi:hypothetical protein